LSAGIELDHYRDVLRQTVLKSLESEDENKAILKKYRKDSTALNESEKENFIDLRKNDYYNRIISQIRDEREGLLSPDDLQTLNRFFQVQYLSEIKKIEDNVWHKLAQLGINPAGPNPSMTTNGDTEWKDLLNWEGNKVIRVDSGGGSSFFKKIIHKCNIEQLITIFAHKKPMITNNSWIQ